MLAHNFSSLFWMLLEILTLFCAYFLAVFLVVSKTFFTNFVFVLFAVLTICFTTSFRMTFMVFTSIFTLRGFLFLRCFSHLAYISSPSIDRLSRTSTVSWGCCSISAVVSAATYGCSESGNSKSVAISCTPLLMLRCLSRVT
jgi:hypothetical protein